ncbi:MAG: formylglycine-generating enzyme family protein [Nostocaceae cyanobacterium]|nr:formylglycine-generating enzyme family protein [Nostocaceae cyanobacterium]
MTTLKELNTIIDRVLAGGRDKKDIVILRRCLKMSDNREVKQSAKYIVNVPGGENIYIGDQINHQCIDDETKLSLQKIEQILQKIDEKLFLSPSVSPQTNSESFVDTTNSKTQSSLTLPPPSIKTFDFEVITVDIYGRETKLLRKEAEFFIENLNYGVLEMVSIPGGKFNMGASKDEEASRDDERPQHLVSIQPFFFARYPITQAQWRVIANLPKVKHDLDLEPSRFKGDNLPVERVCWYSASEFCERLSRETGRTYRLPSEAEWEYACRSKEATPFHYGKTITTSLANYCGQDQENNGRLDKGTYSCEPGGIYRQQTTEVGSFPANAFGLCDMHGLVWEWCTDYEHDDYQGAPSDGTSWLNEQNSSEYRVLRGGSWHSPPHLCRSASRLSEDADITDSRFGFRVVCSWE